MKYIVSITNAPGLPHVDLGTYYAKDGQDAIRQAQKQYPEYKGCWYATPTFEQEKTTA